MITKWHAKVTKPGSISLFYKFKTSDVREELIKIRKIDNKARFKDIKYVIFTELAIKMAREHSSDEPITSISIFNVEEAR